MRALLLALAILLLAACTASGGGGGGAGSPQPPPGGPARALDGTWVLRAGANLGHAAPIVADRPITLVIDGTKVGGSACNIYGGTVTIDGDRIHFSAMSMTEMACQEPLMSAESAYHAALARVETFAQTGDTLTLRGPQVELQYARLPKVAAAPLVGTSWTLSGVRQGETVSSPIGERATLILKADGSLTGSTGCRGFGGRYTIDGDRVSVSGLVMDLRLCTRELMAQDELVLGALDGAFTFAVSGRTLTIAHAGGIGLTYSS